MILFIIHYTLHCSKKLNNNILAYIGISHISGVGKSSIITKYIKGDFSKECEATIGASFMYAKVTIRDYQITLKVLILLLYFITNWLY